MPVNFNGVKAQLLSSAEQALNEFVDELAEEIRESAPVSRERRRQLTLADVSAETVVTVKRGPKTIRDIERERRNIGRFGFTKYATEKFSGFRNLPLSEGMAPEQLRVKMTFSFSPAALQLFKGRATRARRGTASKHQPGTLKRSIYATHAVEESGKFTAKVGASVRYAQAVDHGAHGNERNRGFFSRPVEQKRNNAAAILAEKFRRVG